MSVRKAGATEYLNSNSGSGITGPQGPTGPQGVDVTGPQGLTGFQGPTGPQGIDGETGSQGITGPSSSGVGCNLTTVGTSGDYPTVKSALDDGERNLLLISDVTETATTTLTAGDIYIEHCYGTTWTFNPDIQLDGLLFGDIISIKMNNSFIVYSRTSPADTIRITGSSPQFIMEGVGTITNNTALGVSSSRFVSSGSDQSWNGKIFYNCGNDRFSGLSFTNDFYIEDMVVIGPSTSCSEVFQVDTNSEGQVNHLRFQGTFNTASSRPMCNIAGASEKQSTFSHLGVSLSNSSVYMNIAARFLNIFKHSEGAFFVGNIIMGSACKILGGDISGASNVEFNDQTHIQDTNISMASLSASSIDDNVTIINCSGTSFTNDLSIDSPACRILNNYNMGGITIGANSSLSRISGNQCGDITSTGGTRTINVNASANNCILTENYVDDVIVDSSTTAIQANNFVY